jgi:alpha-L-arabinofuranosidase
VVKRVVFFLGCVGGFCLTSSAVTRVVSLSAPSLEAHNTPDDPDRVSPQDMTAPFQKEARLRPYSYTVVELRKRSNGKG